MKLANFNFWDVSFAGVLVIFAFIKGGVPILLAVIACLLYMLVRIQFRSATTGQDFPRILAADRSVSDPRSGGAVRPIELLRRQLAEAEAEEMEAFKEVRRWGNPWYEEQWERAKEKSRCLADELSKRRNGRRKRNN